jgi:hypothetical protein
MTEVFAANRESLKQPTSRNPRPTLNETAEFQFQDVLTEAAKNERGFWA